jgi:hypothetical protein
MVTYLQFAAVAAYLLWCLCASLSGRCGSGEHDETPIIDESNKNVPVA